MEHAGTLAPPLLMCGLGQSRGAPGFSCTDSWRVRGVTKGRGDKKIQLLASDLEPAFGKARVAMQGCLAFRSHLALSFPPCLPSSTLSAPHTQTRHWQNRALYLQEGEFGGGGIHQAAAPGAVHQVPTTLKVHSVPGVVELSGEALAGLVAKALGVARHGDTLHAGNPGDGDMGLRRGLSARGVWTGIQSAGRPCLCRLTAALLFVTPLRPFCSLLKCLPRACLP